MPYAKLVKCLVWDLDNTIWDGVLLEDPEVQLRPDVVDVIQKLDERGVLQSVASKGEEAIALSRLRELGLADYFLYPQINWSPKSYSIRRMAERLNISTEAVALIDDDPFERDEVKSALPEVRCYEPKNLPDLADLPEFSSVAVTQESRMRRLMYIAEERRRQGEENFAGSREEFLAKLGLVLTISKAKENDLRRAEELTVRTHQLNTTGIIYSYKELQALSRSDRHLLLIAELEDKYGSHGKIGLALAETTQTLWTIKLLLMSCRVISRGVGSILLTHLVRMSRDAGVRLRAQFIPNDRNRIMLITLRLVGFKQVEPKGGRQIFEHPLISLPSAPTYVQIRIL